MSNRTDRYVLSSHSDGHERLRLLCQIHDEHTQKLLKKAGLGPGTKYLEFGCGLGYVSRWAAAQGAEVTAADLSDAHLAESARLAEAEGLTNITWVNENVYEHGLPEGHFDIAYMRYVLVHLNRPVEAMKAIQRALKPGGVLISEECDLGTVYTQPPQESYARFCEVALKLGEKRKVDYAGGMRTHLWAREAGYEVDHVHAYQPHYAEGAEKRFWSWTLAEAGEAVVEEGIETREGLTALLEDLRRVDEDRDVLLGHARVHQLIARKP